MTVPFMCRNLRASKRASEIALHVTSYPSSMP